MCLRVAWSAVPHESKSHGWQAFKLLVVQCTDVAFSHLFWLVGVLFVVVLWAVSGEWAVCDSIQFGRCTFSRCCSQLKGTGVLTLVNRLTPQYMYEVMGNDHTASG